MNKKIITQSVKVALTAGALAAALTGCCMFGPKDCCCGKKDCCCKEPCKCCCEKKCDGKNTHGINTSMTVGVGTDGIRVGSLGASANANVGAGANGVTAGAGGGVN